MIDERGSQYITKTVPCYLRVRVTHTSDPNLDYCNIHVIQLKSKKVDILKSVEGQFFSSTYSIKFLNETIDNVHSMTNSSEKYKEEDWTPCILNWAEVSVHGRSRYRIYMIYSKIEEGKPWIATSFTSKHIADGFRVGFMAILPQDLGHMLEHCVKRNGNLILEVEG